MRSKQLIALIYSLTGLGYGFSGLVMLAAPSLWLQLFPLFTAPTPDAELAVRLLGAVDITLAPLFFWCARNLKRCRPVRLALTMQACAFAALVLTALVTRPAGLAGAVALIVMAVLPAVFMLLLGMPARTVRIKGPREQGVVKWFNANKGFGFITRDSGDDIFVHYRAIRGEGHRTLHEGERVEFHLKRGDKGLQADDVQLI